MEREWLHHLSEAIAKARKPAAYLLVLVALTLKFTPWSRGLDFTLVALALLLLPVFFEIHRKVTLLEKTSIFDSFDSASSKVNDIISQLTNRKGPHKIRYLGMVLFNWPYVEASLLKNLRQSRIKDLEIDLLILNPTWPLLDSLNPTWSDLIKASVGSIKNFKVINDKLLNELNWKLTIKYYECPICGVSPLTTRRFFPARPTGKTEG